MDSSYLKSLRFGLRIITFYVQDQSINDAFGIDAPTFSLTIVENINVMNML